MHGDGFALVGATQHLIPQKPVCGAGILCESDRRHTERWIEELQLQTMQRWRRQVMMVPLATRPSLAPVLGKRVRVDAGLRATLPQATLRVERRASGERRRRARCRRGTGPWRRGFNPSGAPGPTSSMPERKRHVGRRIHAGATTKRSPTLASTSTDWYGRWRRACILRLGLGRVLEDYDPRSDLWYGEGGRGMTKHTPSV